MLFTFALHLHFLRGRAGDVVAIPVGVKHWHGAAKDSWFVHIAIEIPGENTLNEWQETVSDEAYLRLK